MVVIKKKSWRLVVRDEGGVHRVGLHCNTAVNTHSCDSLRKLVEYMARGPLSNERLELLADGKVKLKLKTPWHDRTSRLLLTPSEFLEKLAASTQSYFEARGEARSAP